MPVTVGTARRRASATLRLFRWRQGRSNTHPDPADARKLRNRNIPRLQRELAHERAGHDDVARPQPPAMLAKFFGEPLNRVQGIAEHGRTEPARHFIAVELNTSLHPV